MSVTSGATEKESFRFLKFEGFFLFEPDGKSNLTQFGHVTIRLSEVQKTNVNRSIY